MEPPYERACSEELEANRNSHSHSSERLLHDGDTDAEKFLLLSNGSGSDRKATWSHLRSWPTKTLVLVTILNVFLFLASIVILSVSKNRSISDQDYWRATS